MQLVIVTAACHNFSSNPLNYLSQYSLFFYLHRKSKDDTWVSNNTYWELRKDPDFTHIEFPTLWWPRNCRPHTFWPAQPLLCSRLVLVVAVFQSYHPHSVLVFIAVHQSYCLNSKCLYKLCKHVYANILWECRYILASFAHIFTWYVTLYDLNWENYLVQRMTKSLL